MFGKSIKLFKIFGFAVKIDLSWFIILGLITWSLAEGLFPLVYEDLPRSILWLMGLAGALGLFAGCWLCCSNEPCWQADGCFEKDLDCNGCVVGGDLGLFAGPWLTTCDAIDAQIGYPLCQVCSGQVDCP